MKVCGAVYDHEHHSLMAVLKVEKNVQIMS